MTGTNDPGRTPDVDAREAAEAAAARALARTAGHTVDPPAARNVRDTAAAAAERLGVPDVALSVPKVSWWATATPAQINEWMADLTYWTEWLITTYELHHDLVPACWTLHPGLVQELWALRCLHALNHQPGSGANALPGPITFAASFAAWRERIKVMFPNFESCRTGHKPFLGDSYEATRRAQYPYTAQDFRWRWPEVPIDPLTPRSAL